MWVALTLLAGQQEGHTVACTETFSVIAKVLCLRMWSTALERNASSTTLYVCGCRCRDDRACRQVELWPRSDSCLVLQ